MDVVNFNFEAKQKALIYSSASERLAVGGVRSGKTTGALMFGVNYYCLRYRSCDMLVLRRTFPELEAGAITDLKTFAVNPEDQSLQFDWNDNKHTATFGNGSRIIFGSCQNNRERDIEKYLGQAYPFILVDECAQFSPDAWELLKIRNTINAGCMPVNGTFPFPVLIGCTNPIGPYWLYYKSLFIDKKPPLLPEGAKRDAESGKWWVSEGGEERCIYDPAKYNCVHSTVLDNSFIVKRDPGLIARLDAMPKAKRDKFLFGLTDAVEGQYFDSFSPEHHVINLRETPDAILWQAHQPCWAGWDWGMAHHNCIYLFTKALVRKAGGDYKLKTVCFGEIVTTGKSQGEMVAMLKAKCRLPNGTAIKLSAIYFSHEKFNRQMEQHTPADVLSQLLREVGLCMVSPATRDRIGRASFCYNLLQTGEVVILDTCPEIIQALPILQRDPDQLDDVLKADNKADDCWDGWSYGIFGQLAPRGKSREQAQLEQVHAIADPFARHLAQFKMTMNAQKGREQSQYAGWASHIRQPRG
jgi:hypothetical protein